ncbi:hypothetical protein H8K55_16370 [Undibacterium sp. LX15W]|uniref:Uncharacterized protein n=1 Tax=Undibacterium flavidum TaxID=2762297 RepID=A0ABR6YF72_9BURK|nr:hypothetical protein [Undibacterium flavidum]
MFLTSGAWFSMTCPNTSQAAFTLLSALRKFLTLRNLKMLNIPCQPILHTLIGVLRMRFKVGSE